MPESLASFIGIDLGTSACRGCLVNASGTLQAFAKAPLPKPICTDSELSQDADLWWIAVDQVVTKLGTLASRTNVTAMAVDGTSGTLVYCDRSGDPVTPALMYNDQRPNSLVDQITDLAPQASGAHGASSSLAKFLHFKQQFPQLADARALHQADWILGRLCGNYGISDEHNALKLGFDPIKQNWPSWLETLGIDLNCLPLVHRPGTVAGYLQSDLAQRWGLSDGVKIVTGTTDSTAGILATGADHPGQAITSLGSTLVTKVLSTEPIFAPDYGVYSHRVGDLWLAGGASNSGGAVLDQYFSNEELDRLSKAMDPNLSTGLDYYPLPRPGERFPERNPNLSPRLTPRPDSDTEFLQGLLEGIATIEQRGYEVLHDLGAPRPDSILTVGGGAKNEAWSGIRSRILGIPVRAAVRQEAAYGTALLARDGSHLREL